MTDGGCYWFARFLEADRHLAWLVKEVGGHRLQHYLWLCHMDHTWQLRPHTHRPSLHLLGHMQMRHYQLLQRQPAMNVVVGPWRTEATDAPREPGHQVAAPGHGEAQLICLAQMRTHQIARFLRQGRNSPYADLLMFTHLVQQQETVICYHVHLIHTYLQEFVYPFLDRLEQCAESVPGQPARCFTNSIKRRVEDDIDSGFGYPVGRGVQQFVQVVEGHVTQASLQPLLTGNLVFQIAALLNGDLPILGVGHLPAIASGQEGCHADRSGGGDACEAGGDLPPVASTRVLQGLPHFLAQFVAQCVHEHHGRPPSLLQLVYGLKPEGVLGGEVLRWPLIFGLQQGTEALVHAAQDVPVAAGAAVAEPVVRTR